MPNHVLNEVTFCGLPDAQIHSLRTAACNADGEVDFEILLPTPLNSWPGNVGAVHEKFFPYTDLDWCAKNWSTKWNAYGSRSFVQKGDVVTLEFQTAWRPPYGWLLAIFKSVRVSFVHTYLSEGEPAAKTGTWSYPEMSKLLGNPWVEIPADEATHKRMHMLLWGVESFLDEEDEPCAIS